LFIAAGAPLAEGGVAFAARPVPSDFAHRLPKSNSKPLPTTRKNNTCARSSTNSSSSSSFSPYFFLFADVGRALSRETGHRTIEALAEGTREVSSGNFDYQVPEQAQDELGLLVKSFNAMTTQLRDSRGQIDQFTRNLQQAVQELERRRQLMETVLESIPTAVLSLDADARIVRTNSAVARIFGPDAPQAETLDDLLGPNPRALYKTSCAAPFAWVSSPVKSKWLSLAAFFTPRSP